MTETLNQITTVSIKDVRPNMLLAEDIVSKNGIVIMAKNTMINNTNFNKLLENDIQKIQIWTTSIEEDKKSLESAINSLEITLPIPERAEFKSFTENYSLKLDVVKDNLLAIGTTGDIDINQMYKITNDIVSNINCKSDVLNYLGYLKKADDPTYTHSINVSLLCNLFAKWAGMDEEDTKELTVAGLLHDIGKTKIDNDILNKKGKLNPDEFETMKKHAYLGYKMIQNSNISEEIKKAVLMHHEKIDGSGYPLHLKGDKIGRFAKIVCICDIYDAMTSNRVYRSKICPFEVIRNFELNSLGVLDTEYLLIFLQNIAYTYVGSKVLLSNGEEAEVVFINASDMADPIVKFNDIFIDLAHNPSLRIDSIL